MEEWKYSILMALFAGPLPLFSFLIVYTVGRTPWTGDQPAQNKRPETSKSRVRFEPTIVVIVWAKTVLGYCGRRSGNTIPLFKILVLVGGEDDRLCGLVVRVLGYRSGDPGSIPSTTMKKVMGLERGSLSLVITTEELLDRKVAAPV
jgi:hypothetical protein